MRIKKRERKSLQSIKLFSFFLYDRKQISRHSIVFQLQLDARELKFNKKFY